MFRATTPTHIFIFEVDPEENFKTILITYSQGGEIVLEKGKNDLTFEEKTECNKKVYLGTLQLTQEESNLFEADRTVLVQIRAVSYDGDVVASEKMSVSVKDVLNDEVLT